MGLISEDFRKADCTHLQPEQQLWAILQTSLAFCVGKEHGHNFQGIQQGSTASQIHIRPYIMLDETESIAKVRYLGCKQ